MGRNIRSLTVATVAPADAPMAPHRYQYEVTLRPDGQPAKDLDLCDTFAERKANYPYVTGEFVWIDRNGEAVRAHILHVAYNFNYPGERREYYTVQHETKTGEWSKNWIRVYPGDIQRGYQRAGLASDVDRWAPLKTP
jgi:hypothetical protein